MIETVFPKTKVQLCIVHQVRNSLKYVSYKQRKEIATDLKTIYRADTLAQAEDNLLAFAEKWDGEHGVCQHSCHPYLNQATKTSLALTRLDRRTGLRAVGSTGEQFLTALPFQRAGFSCFAITSTDSRLARISPSLSV